MSVTTAAQPTATQLIPGDPQAVLAFARRIRATGDDAVRPIAVDQQHAETATAGWVGAGGDAARARLQAVGRVWSDAAHVLDQLADAVEAYARELQQAQAGAAQAISYQNQAEASSWSAVAFWYHARAELTLKIARMQLYFASTTLAAAFDQATRTLPGPAPADQPVSLQSPWNPAYDPQQGLVPSWLDPSGSWQLPNGPHYPYTPGVVWPSFLYPPTVLSDQLRAKLEASPYTEGALDSLPKHSGWGFEGFGFVGVNAEADVNHVGLWGFGGLFVSTGVKGVGTGDATPVISVGDIYGAGPAVGTPIGAVEAGLLWEDGWTASKHGVESFGSATNPNLYVALAGSKVEGGLLIHNEPGEACVYTPFVGVAHPRFSAEAHVGPVGVQGGLWGGVGFSVTKPSAATTPWECIPYLPESIRAQLPWWANKPRHE
jgi:hypothetical protein